MFKKIVLFFIFAVIFLCISKTVYAGSEACTNPSYPTCWPNRVINEYTCTKKDTAWVCTDGDERIISDGAWNCNNNGWDDYCDKSVKSGSKCQAWYTIPGSGIYDKNASHCFATDTRYVNCITSNGKCSVTMAGWQQCSYQSTYAVCVNKKDVTYSCCGGGAAPAPGDDCGDGSCNNGETCSTCPGDCGNCVNCISTKGHEELPKDCNKTGFYGRSYAILRDPNRTLPIGETYSCNPYPELIGNGEACGYWSNKWTGYLTIPETGDYEFWIT